MVSLIVRLNTVLNQAAGGAGGISLLLLRIYLMPVLAQAGWQKLTNLDSTADWFGNPDYGLGLPLPMVMAVLAAVTEFFGAWLLLFGLGTRLVAIPMMITMLVAMFTVHWNNGWLAIADANSWLADGTLLLNESVMASPEKLAAAKSLLAEHGHIDWLTASGNFVILNNGIEFASTYFVMLFVLFCFGGGRYVSIDYYLHQWLRQQASKKKS
ncbi:HvfX family Cu-binding RiPP maturation protein [Alteromonas gilva]|uniref:DoxX family protein n=1 Tax=Alteromonas gilva TaxID=2987522 RepID=A0ABT5L4R8_9ALTE|nr:DoxX family protein [Alteromonas gilva]MDC8830857.1 DoxX family protein [Alteromonas gilva]